MTAMGLAVSKHEAFWEACGFGHTEKVRKFIEDGIDVNWKSYAHSYTCIHVASQGKPAIVRMLIEANCNVNVLDDSNNLAMHHAAMRGHADIMQMLIDAGSKIEVQNNNGWTPLINAAYWCQPAAVEVLIKHNCDVHLRNKDERMALHEACRSQSEAQGDLAKVTQLLVDAGSDVNSKASDAGEADFTPLIFAAYHGHPEVAKVLINAHCELDTQTSNEWTALHWAADRGHVEVVAALVEAGANTQMKGRRGELAYDRAKTDVIRKLLRSTTTGSAPKCQREEPVARVRSPNTGSSGLGDGTLRKSPNNATMTSSEFVKFLLGPAAPPNGSTRKRVSRTIDRPAEPTVPPPNDENPGMTCLDDIPCIDDDSDDDAPQQADQVTNDAHNRQMMTETGDNSTDASKTTATLPTIDELAKEMDCINCNTDALDSTTVMTQPSMASVGSDKTSSEVGFELHATNSQTDLKSNGDAAAMTLDGFRRPLDMSDDDIDAGDEEVVNHWRSDVDLIEYQKDTSAAAASSGDKGFTLHATNSQTNLIDDAGADHALSDMSLGTTGKKVNDIDASGAASETSMDVQQTERQRPEAASGGADAQ